MFRLSMAERETLTQLVGRESVGVEATRASTLLIRSDSDALSVLNASHALAFAALVTTVAFARACGGSVGEHPDRRLCLLRTRASMWMLGPCLNECAARKPMQKSKWVGAIPFVGDDGMRLGTAGCDYVCGSYYPGLDRAAKNRW